MYSRLATKNNIAQLNAALLGDIVKAITITEGSEALKSRFDSNETATEEE